MQKNKFCKLREEAEYNLQFIVIFLLKYHFRCFSVRVKYWWKEVQLINFCSATVLLQNVTWWGAVTEAERVEEPIGLQINGSSGFF